MDRLMKLLGMRVLLAGAGLMFILLSAGSAGRLPCITRNREPAGRLFRQMLRLSREDGSGNTAKGPKAQGQGFAIAGNPESSPRRK